MDGKTPSGFTDTPTGTGVGEFAPGTKYTKMADPVYTNTPATPKYTFTDKKERDPKNI